MVFVTGAGFGCSKIRSRQPSAIAILPAVPIMAPTQPKMAKISGMGMLVTPQRFRSCSGIKIAATSSDPYVPTYPEIRFIVILSCGFGVISDGKLSRGMV